MYQKKDAGQQQCVCSDPHYIVGERKALSHIVALALLIGFFIFVSGYFIGKRSASQEFLHQFEQESFADRISHSLHTQYSPQAAVLDSTKQTDAAAQPQAPQDVVPAKTGPTTQENAKAEKGAVVAPSTHEEAQPVVAEKVQQKIPAKVTYYAQLFGGTREAAQRFVDLLGQRGITTRMIKKSSKTAQSNMVYWYQVETDRFADRAALEDLVSTIKRIAKLHDVKIIKG